MAAHKTRLKQAIPILAGLAVILILAPIYSADLPAVSRLRNIVFDTYQQFDPRPPYPDSVVTILDIDEASLKNIGQWPWPRSYLASIVEYLQQVGVGVVAFDVLFSEADRTSPARVFGTLPDTMQEQLGAIDFPDNDETLAETVSRGGIVLGQVLLPLQESPAPAPPPEKFGIVSSEPHAAQYLYAYPSILRALPVLEDAAAGLGLVNIVPDNDGVIRTVPLFLRYKPRTETNATTPDDVLGADWGSVQASLSMETLSVYLQRLTQMLKPDNAPAKRTYRFKTVGGSGEQSIGGAETGIVYIDTGGLPDLRFKIETDANAGLRIHYARKETQPVISMWDLVQGKVDPNELAGRIVLVGTSAAGLHDLRFNTLGEEIPGVFVHAQIIDQVMSGHFLTRPDYAQGLEIVAMLVLSVALIVVIYLFGALVSGLLGLTIVAAGLAGSAYAFHEHHMLLDPVLPSITALGVFMACSLAKYWQTERDQRWVRNAFKTFVSPNLVESLALHPEALKLGGTRKEVTFIFTDLAGFTTFVEQSDPEVSVPLLNEYIDNMVRIGLKHGGYLDKIIGDATVFHFNSFLPPLDQPDHAQRAYACAVEMDAWATAYSDEKRAQGIPLNNTRIGVNTGIVTIGNFGGAVMDYTALGDAINTAARLESGGKFLGVNVSVSGETKSRVDGFIGRPCGILVLKGQSVDTPVYEPMSEDRLNSAPIQKYLEAYALMEAEDPRAADVMAEVLDLTPDDGLAKLHLDRLRNGETGIRIVMTSK
ncbi:adenylate/guanylate cyclase domain-containing protein [Rhodospirillaceae bacterium KN72]|uniref:Adenylate/guanylate cyclase domain-containing protein n=1 Tax=Pacificispira spongiicola TaxID=2729598 RepID=A0A7Y0DZD3_9PROT|nr:adenylate/guanylate cyclase domain-containing protein [Pacificispira spongiicola]NMM44397.1 adenylate/guanylate cyclase domain-containing protein [Pacificispira spongiicola]